MPVPKDAVGRALPEHVAVIERGRLRFFAEAIGETDPRYLDVDAAVDAGYPDLPVPPTFLFGLKLDKPDPMSWLADLGVDPRFVLHGSQRYDYARMAFAGDELRLAPRIAEVYEKRGGALEFIVVDTEVTRDGEPIATLTDTVVVRHPEQEAAR
ncbi:MaoC family dehydratase N-terminal domain-containing protein [Microbacterium sp. EST19A]|uniref:MaoC family dehydratase N-terminal domain-containing protein n=1 Tax=Microbacterium sp. EST19A TaxID=2862681 RepID=UPI001CBA96E8|nr:MaoC family dehydratase N-terminal domain-containing protein [Microbacterium sp. EST19A]